jgi:hypothetical protein
MESTPNDKNAASSCTSEQYKDGSNDEVTDYDEKEKSVATDEARLVIDYKDQFTNCSIALSSSSRNDEVVLCEEDAKGGEDSVAVSSLILEETKFLGSEPDSVSTSAVVEQNSVAPTRPIISHKQGVSSSPHDLYTRVSPHSASIQMIAAIPMNRTGETMSVDNVTENGATSLMVAQQHPQGSFTTASATNNIALATHGNSANHFTTPHPARNVSPSPSNDADNDTSPTKSRKILLVGAVLALVVLLVIVGGVCGSGHCTQSSSSEPALLDESTPQEPESSPPPPYFTTTQELQQAVDEYLDWLAQSEDNIDNTTGSSSNDTLPSVGQRYGHSIGMWDVSRIADFSRLFDPN